MWKEKMNERLKVESRKMEVKICSKSNLQNIDDKEPIHTKRI